MQFEIDEIDRHTHFMDWLKLFGILVSCRAGEKMKKCRNLNADA